MKNSSRTFILCFFSLLITSCGSKNKKNSRFMHPAESEYRLSNGVSQDAVRFSSLRYKAERGKVFLLVEIIPTEVVARPGFNQYQLYNQALRNIMHTECTSELKKYDASLGFVEHLEIQTQRYTNFSYRTWGRGICHGYVKNLNYNL